MVSSAACQVPFPHALQVHRPIILSALRTHAGQWDADRNHGKRTEEVGVHVSSLSMTILLRQVVYDELLLRTCGAIAGDKVVMEIGERNASSRD